MSFNMWAGKALSAILCLTVWGCDVGPSCTEMGGTVRYSNTIYIYQPALKMLQHIPQYECVLPDKDDVPNRENEDQ